MVSRSIRFSSPVCRALSRLAQHLHQVFSLLSPVQQPCPALSVQQLQPALSHPAAPSSAELELSHSPVLPRPAVLSSGQPAHSNPACPAFSRPAAPSSFQPAFSRQQSLPSSSPVVPSPIQHLHKVFTRSAAVVSSSLQSSSSIACVQEVVSRFSLVSRSLLSSP